MAVTVSVYANTLANMLNKLVTYTTLKTELLNNLAISSTVSLPTAGKELVETPKNTYGARVELYPMSNLSLGLQGKLVGKRYSTDLNDAQVDAYKIFDLDARYTIEVSGLKNLSIRANVSNLFDEKYYGSISSTNGAVALTGFTPSAPFYFIGSPRTVSATVQVQF